MLIDFYCLKAEQIRGREGLHVGDILHYCPAGDPINPALKKAQKIPLDVEPGTYEDAKNISEVQ